MRMSRSIAVVTMAIVFMLSFGAAASFAQTGTPTPTTEAPTPSPTPPQPTPSPEPTPSPTPEPTPSPTPPAPSTPVPATPQSGQGVPYPVAMHQGTCESTTPEPEVTFDNTSAAGAGVEGAQIVGQNPGPPALVSVGAVDVPLAELAGTPRVIAIHQGPEQFGTVVACGNIAGTLVDGQMVIALQPIQNSGISGVALLNEVDDQTNIVVYVTSPDAVPATPAA